MVISLQQHQPILTEELALSCEPFQLFALMASEPYSFILDSTGFWAVNPSLSRYSFFGFEPFLVMKSYGDDVSLLQDGRFTQEKTNPLDILGKYLKAYKLNFPELPFPLAGGAVGYIGYEIRDFIEKLPCKNPDEILMPQLYFAFYDCLFAYDHLQEKGYILSCGLPEEDEFRRLKRARERIKELKNKMERKKKSLFPCYMYPDGNINPNSDIYYEGYQWKQTANRKRQPGYCLKSNFTHEEYLKGVEKVKQYIVAGDIFQANLSQRFVADISIPPFMLYSRLRQVNPSPFSAYFNYPEGCIACSSPERFLRLTGDKVETRPIKGTRPRGKTLKEDQEKARELLSSAKDRAENIMIVDLERNDLGRVCEYGSVKVEELAALESFPTVFHLTTTISGKLQPGKDIIDLIKAAFPGGSIIGAPKVRAMEIIDELEPDQRGIYTGSLGYISFDGNADLNIIIRTFILKDGAAYFHVGGGIVHDSEPEAEYRETLDKAEGLLRALNIKEEGFKACP